MCSVPMCSFCAGMSIFGTFFMFFLGILIKANYKWVGEWYHPEGERGSPTQDQINEASKNCFIVGAIYIGFTIFAIVCVFYQKARAKSKRS